jgi:lactate dehydrogenase-like 2-hydroxyacid dehydrogenase
MMGMIEEQLAQDFFVLRLVSGALPRPASPGLRAIATGGGHRVDKALMEQLPDLEIVANFGVGYDSVDAAWAGAHGIMVTNTPDVLTEEVADTALGLLIATVRQLPQAERYLRAGKWLERPFPLTASLRGRTIGIVGMGRIGQAIARRIESFGLKVVYHCRTPVQGTARQHYPDLVAMARDVDVLIAILPGGAATRHIIDAQVLEALGPDGIFINVARGSVVDEDALIDALRGRKILSAGLDVFADEPRVRPELIEMDHVVLLPHVASASHYTRNAMGQLVVDNLRAWFAGKGPLNPVPETPWPRAAGR